MKCNVSGQFLYFSLPSAISGNSVVGILSGNISGFRSTDGASGIVLSGPVVETHSGGGLYVAKLFDWDTSGAYIGYFFSSSGTVPQSFSVETDLTLSGRLNIASGPNVVVPPSTLSGVVANSGLFVNATAVVGSGSLYLASGSIFMATFASGVVGGGSGNLPSAWGGSGATTVGQNLVSGSFVTVPISSISGAVANSGLFVTVPIATISGAVANSGLSVTVLPASLSGLFLAQASIFNTTFASGMLGCSGNLPTAWGNSGQVFSASGAFVNATAVVNSGLFVTVPISSISGVTIQSGAFATVLPANLSGVVANSGLFVNATAGGSSGLFVTVPIATISGVNVVATATVASGSLFLAAGSIFMTTFASGVVGGGSGNLPSAWGGSGATTVGQSLISGMFVTVPISSISGVTIQSGAFATVLPANLSGIQPISGATVSVPISSISGAIANSGIFATVLPANLSGLFLAQASIFNTTFASGMLGASGNLPTAWGNSGTVAVGQNLVSGSFATVPISSISGVNAVVPTATLSGVVANSGIFATILPGTISGVQIQSGAFATVPLSSISGVNIASGQSVITAINQDKSGYILSNSGLDLVRVESGMNMRQAQSLIAAAAAGRTSGAGTSDFKIEGANASGVLRIDGTTDQSGNRSAVALTLPT